MADSNTPRTARLSLGPLSGLPSYLYRGLRAAAYPLQGIWYFLRRPAFYPLFLRRLLPLTIISLLVYLILFMTAYLPQVALLAIWQGRGAWFNAAVLVLGEGLVVIQGLFEGFFVDESRVDVFDATLINHDLTDLVAPHRLLFPDAPSSVKMLGKPTTAAAYTPWSLTQIVELICCLPLNLVPYVGVPAFVIITGTRLGKLSQWRWYQLRGLSRKEKKKEMGKMGWEFMWFGTVAMVLELIPILSLFFLLTTTAGSAIWVARLERERRREEEGRQSGAAEQYADDPV